VKKFQLVLTIPALALTLCVGCKSVTERMSPDAEKAEPASAGTYLRGTPADDAALSGNWWDLFDDPTLDILIRKLDAANPDAAAALARVDQSYAALGLTRGARYPTVNATGGIGRRRDSINNLLFPIATPEYNRFQLGMSASWEIDLWGRVRSSVKRDRFRAEAETVNYHSVLLSLQASLAQQYFAHRAADTELRLLREAQDLAFENLKMHESRVEHGLGVAADVSKARLDLQNIATSTEAAERNTGKLLHAIAILTGTMPSKLAALDKGAPMRIPAVPTGLPSDLLVRRPDLLAADRQLRAAAAQVGIRKADFLPKLTLMGSAGVASLQANNLFEANSGLFDIGPNLEIPIFQYGSRKNAVAQAKAEFREAGANFKSAFLTAVKEVDDALLDTRSYTRELDLQRQAVQAANETATAAKDRFDTGLADYFEFVTAEQTHLQSQAQEAALISERQLSAVRLIQALGGSWESSERER
jgi:NodT family efflux transporter outer membrane factor (OMF) lipoprotein